MPLWSKKTRTPATELGDASSPAGPASELSEEGEPEQLSESVPAPRVRVATQQDPLVRVLGLTILIIIALTLVTVVYALLTGVFGTGAPRTMTEQRIVAAQAKVEAGSTDPRDWMGLILALIDDGQFAKAQEWIDKGDATLPDQEYSAEMAYMQADLHLAQGDAEEALEVADQALATMKSTTDAMVEDFKVTGRPNKGTAYGLSDIYYEVLLLKAEIFETREEWTEALACYDEYLAENPTAATVFTERGEVKEQLGDTEGAEADFRQTLTYIADDTNALAGLDRIGADR